jgi:hypothetical protein
MDLSLTHLLGMGQSALGFVKSFDMPLGCVKKACQAGSFFSATTELSQEVLKSVRLAIGPSDIATLALKALALARSWKTPEAELVLSIFQKSCDVGKWLHHLHLVPSLGRFEVVGILSDLSIHSLHFWEDRGPHPKEGRSLIITISKIFKACLLLYIYVTDDKRVKVIAEGIGVLGDGYSLFQKGRDYRTWQISQVQICQIIISLSAACLTLYVIERFYLKTN